MIRISIHVHENYIQTRVRTFLKTGGNYNSYTRIGESIPLNIFESETVDDILKIAQNEKVCDFDITKCKFLPTFEGYFEMDIVILSDDVSKFIVDKASYVMPKLGSQDVKGAFQHPQFRKPIMLNLFKAFSEKDVTKIHTVLNALNVVGG